jgi:HAE1 family hydrophobic/amphiphilic exporter-1
MGLTRLALSRPIFFFMLMLGAVLMGLSSYFSMRVEENPDVQFGVISVTTIYPGAGPDEVANLITKKIEDACSGVNGLREVTSTSREGVSTVVANFEVGTDMDIALNDVRAKVDAVAPTLPSEVDKPTITKFDSSSTPVMYLSVAGERYTPRELRDVLEDKVKDRIGQIDGVATVGIQGGEVRELQVHLQKDKLAAYKIGIAQIQRAVQAATMNVPAGRIRTKDQEYSVRVLGEFKSAEELANLNLAISDPTNPMGPTQNIRLGDIATVSDTVEERTSFSRLNGKDAVIMTVQKTREGNAIEISNTLKQLLPKLEKEYNLNFQITQNSATRISESISDLMFALAFGIFLVAVIVYMFLHNFRGTLIVAIAIPLCIMVTFMVMKMLGFTINNMSMLALSLAIGVLVDDAIVVLENIFRHLQKGEDPREAAINGRSEIGLAAIAICLADVVVFVPIGNMGGIVGQFFKPLGIGYAVCVLISLLVSFTVTPLLASRWYRKGENVEHFETGFAGWFERTFNRFSGMYRSVLNWALNHRWFVFILGNLALIAVIMLIGGTTALDNKGNPSAAIAIGRAIPLVILATIVGGIVFIVNIFRGFIKPQFILYGFLFGLLFPAASVGGVAWRSWKQEDVLKGGFFPPSDQGAVQISVELPQGSSVERTAEVVTKVEEIVSKHPDVEYVISSIGEASGTNAAFSSTSSGSHIAALNVTLHEKKALMDSITFWKKHEGHLRTKSDTSIVAELTEALYQNRIPGARIKVSALSGFNAGAPIQVSLTGPDRALVAQTAENIRRRLANGEVPGLINADISSKPGRPEVRAIPDREKLANYNLTVGDLAGTMRIMYEGNDDTKFRVGGKEYGIRVMMDPKDRNNPDIINTLPIAFIQGNPIFLSQVASLQDGVGLDKIERRDRTDEIRVMADTLPGVGATNVQAALDKFIADEKLLPEGVRTKALGQADFQAREGIYLMTALITGLVLVYMLLAALFENLLYPMIIQMAQPQAMVGALLALMITDKTLNIVGFIGLITLVGLVGKNAILLVDYTNTLRERGYKRFDALLEAGPTRLRPIMMTTFALILGTLPIALAIGRGSEFRETIGITIIGGILLSTFLTLLVIPCSYTIFDDISEAFYRRRHKGKASQHGTAAGSTPNPEEQPTG